MLISPELAYAINEQIGREFDASMRYLSITGHFQGLGKSRQTSKDLCVNKEAC